MTDPHVSEAGPGTGPNLVLLHGIGGSADTFASQFAEWGDRLRLLAWDAPGYARSADPEWPLSLDDYADLVAALIRERCGAAHVLGMSWGGVIATRLALRHPELLRSLILGAASVGSGATAAGAAAMRARATELDSAGATAFAAARAPKLLSPQADPSTVAAVAAAMAGAIRPAGYRSAAESMAATDHTADLPRIEVPTLVLCGDRDTVTGPPAAQVLAGGIPGAVFVTLRGAGHLANQERPEAFGAWVESFVHITERLRPRVTA
ncbi:alpha/beta fold hydrolase [Nocardia aurantia]|uniref:3-oxoadipate enol-lactonase 2 n=1 Tax=Nocardia aurantia TaxID=2585199 RepID=A0A7K0DSZ4_9NOCA|nr:alpha/beta fold hydrolase [Nocardia aurantia]MQY28698.1 3-oxoadipate enol-lactonase 2 [Nocardia aurantia]